MAHIELPEGLPGIVGPMVAYPETEKHLNGLADALAPGDPQAYDEMGAVIAENGYTRTIHG